MKDLVPEKCAARPLRKWQGRAVIFLASVAIAATVGAPAAAAVTPGTPIEVSPGVPDQGRAWELVTSPDLVSASVSNTRAIAVDGARVAYMTRGLLPGAEISEPFISANVSERGPDGWINRPMITPHPEAGMWPGNSDYTGPQFFSPDLSNWYGLRDLAAPVFAAPELPAIEGHLYRWPLQGSSYTDLADLGAGGNVVGSSVDTERIFVISADHLLSGDVARTEGTSVYEIHGGSLRLVDVDNGGALISNCGATVSQDPNSGGEIPGPFPPAVSLDGARIFFAARPGCSGSQRVFVREDASTTTEISNSQCTRPDCGPAADVTFVGATPAGDRAFLVTAQQLTNADTNSHADLYRYDVPDGTLTLLSSYPGGPEISATAGFAHCSTDGSRVYFGASDWDGTEPVGREDIYLATAGELRRVPEVGVGVQDAFIQTPSDGRFVIFASAAQLVPGDTDESVDIYKFDADTGSLTRISVGPAGGNASIDARIKPDFLSETAPSHRYRIVSTDGDRIFFTTAERLVVADRNEVADVYEWVDGSLGLVSAGSGKWPSKFIGSTGDGSTAIFATSGTLLTRDRDGGQIDLYAARIGGGFAESHEPPVECVGASCRVSPTRSLATPPLPTTGDSAGGLAVRPLDPSELRRAAHSGRLPVLVEVPSPGRLIARAGARIAGDRRLVARKGVDVSKAGPVELDLRLSALARRRLNHGHDLHIRLWLRLDPQALSGVAALILRGRSR